MKRGLFCLVALLLAAGGCGDKSATGAASGTAAGGTTGAPVSARPAQAPPRPKEPPRGPRKPADPAVMKSFHAERCHVGLLTLGLARTAYEKSMGKDRPGPKIPDLGAPEVKMGNPAHLYLRLARICNVAGAADKPPHEELDKALHAAVEVGPPLAQALSDAGDYYTKKENEKDDFAKGRELHTNIKKGFEKLDVVTKGVGDALPSWHKEFPPKLEAAPAQKSHLIVMRAKAVFEAMLAGKDAAEIDKLIADVVTATDELDAATKDLKGDAYAAYVPKAARTFIERAKAAAADKKIPNLVSVGSGVGSLFEAENNAYKQDISGYVPPDPEADNPHHGMH
ncbi:MAG: DUF3829 domain-containing protein [Polyangiaceae bacterium]|nr:DUF3829 domain-containing protein [Polyangiaceae bacterium]